MDLAESGVKSCFNVLVLHRSYVMLLLAEGHSLCRLRRERRDAAVHAPRTHCPDALSMVSRLIYRLSPSAPSFPCWRLMRASVVVDALIEDSCVATLRSFVPGRLSKSPMTSCMPLIQMMARLMMAENMALASCTLNAFTNALRLLSLGGHRPFLPQMLACEDRDANGTHWKGDPRNGSKSLICEVRICELKTLTWKEGPDARKEPKA